MNNIFRLAFLKIGLIIILFNQQMVCQNDSNKIGIKPIVVITPTYIFSNCINPNNQIKFTKLGIGFDGLINRNVGFRVLTIPKDSYRGIYDAYGYINFNLLFSRNQLLLGQFKVPFSMENMISFFKKDYVFDALLTNFVSSRDLGIGLFGEIDYLEYNFAIINGEGWKDVDKNSVKDFVSRLLYKNSFLRFGGALYLGQSGVDSNNYKFSNYNLQLEIFSKIITFRSEYLKTTHTTKGEGYYFHIGCKFKDVIPELAELLEPTVRIERVRMVNESFNKYTIGLNLFFKGYQYRSQINYEHHYNKYKSSNIIIISFQFAYF